MNRLIYHEKQESLLCGQHCLNNLLQGHLFTAETLASIANQLDVQERQIIDGPFSPGESANVDDSGNFSIQVLRCALQNYNNSDLIPWFSQEGKDLDPLEKQGFVVNRSDHWFTIRKIRDNWWNLNSTLETPEVISQFYLSAFIHGLKAEGYSVFFADGDIPRQGNPDMFENSSREGSGTWYNETQLLNKNKKPENQGEEKKDPFAGKGNRLGGEGEASGTVDNGSFLMDGQDENDEELMLARAISASLEVPKTEKEKAAAVREKRLAALAKRGL